jgi:endonuclease/exonuclease/phosphatase family metal-dependent hydrolase
VLTISNKAEDQVHGGGVVVAPNVESDGRVDDGDDQANDEHEAQHDPRQQQVLILLRVEQKASTLQLVCMHLRVWSTRERVAEALHFIYIPRGRPR